VNGPIINAKDKPLSALGGGIPDVSATVRSFLQPTSIGRVKDQLVNGRAQDFVIYEETMAFRQPMAESLAVRKEGDRSWRWHTIYMTPDLELATNDIIVLSGARFRVMEKTDWKDAGYVVYSVIEDYKKAGTL
jgi:hypothetical protein